jgi:hypothetical protein
MLFMQDIIINRVIMVVSTSRRLLLLIPRTFEEYGILRTAVRQMRFTAST